MALTLVHSKGRHALIGDRPVTIGADRSCDVVIAELSARHAALRPHPRGWTIDASGDGSAGGVALTSGRERLLRPGIPLVLGEVVFECVDVDTVDATPDANTVELALRAMSHAVADGRATWSVVVVEGPDLGAVFELSGDTAHSIGRDGATVTLEHPTVSRRHAEMRVRDDALQVRDTNATHGTYLGDARLEPQRWARWPSDRALRVGDVILACRPPATEIVAARTAAIPATPLRQPVPPERAPVELPEVVVAPVVAMPAAPDPAPSPPTPARASLWLPWTVAGVVFVAAVAALIWIFWGG